MAITEVLKDYTDRCKTVIDQKQDIRENDDLEVEQTESTNRRYLNYTIDVNCMLDEILGNYLRDLSHPELSLLLAIYTCIKEGHDFQEDISSVRQTNVTKDVLIRSIREKQPESMIACLEEALETVEEEDIEFD